MIKVKVLEKIKGGWRDFQPGEIIELPELQAKECVRDGRAQYVVESPVAEAAAIAPQETKTLSRRALHAKKDS